MTTIAAFKHGTYEDFKLFEEFKSHGHAHGTIRQWCRVFLSPERCLLPRATTLSDVCPELMMFFVVRPGLRRLIGSKLSLYYNPCTAAKVCVKRPDAPDGRKTPRSKMCVVM